MMKKSFFKTSYRILCAALAAAVVLPFSPEAYALTGEFQCGLEEHTHYDACYTPVLICELEIIAMSSARCLSAPMRTMRMTRAALSFSLS